MLSNHYIRKKKQLGKKGSYWQKHQEKNGEERPASNERTKALPISDHQKQSFEDGKLLLIDKPLHWTSFDMVRKIRNRIRIKKVGHAGTLDPLATGLLILCTGKFTKKINEYMAQEKEYTGSFTLGAVTPTYDLESTPEQHKDIANITTQMVQDLLPGFLGEIQQFPPIYSAIKKKGTPLYELARRGEDIELQARTINIYSFEFTEIILPVLTFKIVCSTGTYIRSIANDIGAALGCGAYLSELRRTRIGNFNVNEAISIEQFNESIQVPFSDDPDDIID